MGVPNPTYTALSDLAYKSNPRLVTLIKRKCYYLGVEATKLKDNWQEELDASHKIELKRDFKFYYSCAEDLDIEVFKNLHYDADRVLEITKILVELDNK